MLFFTFLQIADIFDKVCYSAIALFVNKATVLIYYPCLRLYVLLLLLMILFCTHISKQTLIKNPFCVHPERKTKKYVIILVILMPLAAIQASP